MHNQALKIDILKVSDQDMLLAIGSLAKDTTIPLASVSFVSQLGINLPPWDPKQPIPPALQEVLVEKGNVIATFNCPIQNGWGNLSIHRQPNQPHDYISVNFANVPAGEPEKQATRLYGRLFSIFPAVDSSDSSKLLDEPWRSEYEKREVGLRRIETIAQNLLVEQEKFQRQALERLQERTRELEEKFAGEKEKLEKSYLEKEEALAKRALALEAKLKEIDDHDSKYARREIRQNLKKTFGARAERFALTEGTRKLRRPVNYFTIALLLGFGGFFFYFLFLSAYELTVGTFDSTRLITIAIRQVVLGLAFGSTSVFYIRWSNRWFERHAKEEFRLKRYEIDMDRASWLVEMALEWKGEKGTEIPDSLLEKLANNLYAEDGEESVDLHPADQVASAILGSAANLELDVPGAKIALDKKGLRNLRRS